MNVKEDTGKFKQKNFSIIIVFALVLLAGQASADKLTIVNAPPLNRDANLIVNGSFEEGHPGVVANPPGSPPNAVYWALVDGGNGYHNPRGRGSLFDYPEAEKTPKGWTGEGGEANYAIWSKTYVPVGAPPGFGLVGPAESTAPSEGLYSLYFGNYHIESLDVPQDPHRIKIEDDGEWIFKDNTGARIDPDIMLEENYDPAVGLSQTVTDICYGATYRLSFTAFGEFGHPKMIDFLKMNGLLITDGFFGLKISGYDMLYLNVPAGSNLDLHGNMSPFGEVGDYTYTVEFIAKAAPRHKRQSIKPSHCVGTHSKCGSCCGHEKPKKTKIKFINWGHIIESHTLLGGTPYEVPVILQEPPEPPEPLQVIEATALVLDDVIMNGATICQDGTGTPGYWKNHPKAWPFDIITIGEFDYTKEEAIVFMKARKRRDVTYKLFRSLVAAKLNKWVGNNSSCVEDTIAAADAWMTKYPVGSGVRAGGRTSPWREGEPLHKKLDKYNNGRLCAPRRS